MRGLLRRVMLVAMNVALRKPRMTREEFFAWAQNLTNAYYSTFGTFSPTSSIFIAQAPGASLTG